MCFKANSETTVLRCSHSCELASRVQSLLLFNRVLDMPACLSTVSEKLFAVPVTTVITKVIGYISSYTLGDFPTRHQQQPAPESESTQHSRSAFLAVHSNFTPKVFSIFFRSGDCDRMYFACTGTLPVETSSSQPVTFPFGFHCEITVCLYTSSGYSPGSHYPISNDCITHLVIHTQSALHRVRYTVSRIHSGYSLSLISLRTSIRFTPDFQT